MQRERQIKSMKSARWIRETLINARAPGAAGLTDWFSVRVLPAEFPLLLLACIAIT
jgi:hypothetical protein